MQSKFIAVILTALNLLMVALFPPPAGGSASGVVPILVVIMILLGVLCAFCSEKLATCTGIGLRGGIDSGPTPAGFFVVFGNILLLLSATILCVQVYTRRLDPAPRNTILSSPTPNGPAPSTPPNRAMLPSDLTLTASIQMPVSIHGNPSGIVTLPRGTRMRIISMSKDSVVVAYLDSKATIPLRATDLYTAIK